MTAKAIVILLSEIEDGKDVRMRQRGDGLGLSLEARESARILREVRGEDLDRDVPIELCVLRPVDLSHAARAERREDLVGAETGARGKAHWPSEAGRILSPGQAAASVFRRRRSASA